MLFICKQKDDVRLKKGDPVRFGFGLTVPPCSKRP